MVYHYTLCICVKVDLFNAFVDIGTGRQIWFFTEKTWYFVLASRLLRNHLIKKSLRTPGCRGYRPPSPPLCTPRFPGPPGSPACFISLQAIYFSLYFTISLSLSFFFLHKSIFSLSLSLIFSVFFFFLCLSFTNSGKRSISIKNMHFPNSCFSQSHRRKIRYDLWLISIYSHAFNRLNDRDCSLRAHALSYKFHPRFLIQGQC